MGIIFLKLIGFIDIYQIMNIIGNYGNYNLVVIRNYFKRITQANFNKQKIGHEIKQKIYFLRVH